MAGRGPPRKPHANDGKYRERTRKVIYLLCARVGEHLAARLFVLRLLLLLRGQAKGNADAPAG